MKISGTGLFFCKKFDSRGSTQISCQSRLTGHFFDQMCQVLQKLGGWWPRQRFD